FDSLAIRDLCKLSNGPFHPTLFFRAVGDTNFDRRAAAQERCRGIFCRLERLLAYENVVSARDAGHYEEENKYPPQGGKFWAFARTGEVCHTRLEECRNIFEYAHNVFRRALVLLRLGRVGNLLQYVFPGVFSVSDGENVNGMGLA